MTLCCNVAHTFVTALVRAVKNRQVLVFKEWCTFHAHCSADHIIRFFYFSACKSKLTKKVELRAVVLLCCKSEALEAFFANSPLVECKAYLKCSGYCLIELFNFFIGEAPEFKRLCIDMRSAY